MFNVPLGTRNNTQHVAKLVWVPFYRYNLVAKNYRKLRATGRANALMATATAKPNWGGRW